jgi:hypothetical protein
MRALAVNTATVTERRQVHLRSLADLLAKVDRIQASAVAGRVRPLGNWTTAQVFHHLAKFVEGSLDGFPFRYPWPLRCLSWLIGRVSWRWLMRLAFRPGFRNPPVAAAVEPDPAVPLEDAGAYLRHQIGRVLGGERMTQRSPTGEIPSHEQWVECHLRHAELHLSFLQLEPGTQAESDPPLTAAARREGPR